MRACAACSAALPEGARFLHAVRHARAPGPGRLHRLRAGAAGGRPVLPLLRHPGVGVRRHRWSGGVARLREPTERVPCVRSRVRAVEEGLPLHALNLAGEPHRAAGRRELCARGPRDPAGLRHPPRRPLMHPILTVDGRRTTCTALDELGHRVAGGRHRRSVDARTRATACCVTCPVRPARARSSRRQLEHGRAARASRAHASRASSLWSPRRRGLRRSRHSTSRSPSATGRPARAR